MEWFCASPLYWWLTIYLQVPIIYLLHFLLELILISLLNDSNKWLNIFCELYENTFTNSLTFSFNLLICCLWVNIKPEYSKVVPMSSTSCRHLIVKWRWYFFFLEWRKSKILTCPLYMFFCFLPLKISLYFKFQSWV